jgi:hypothetical protein
VIAILIIAAFLLAVASYTFIRSKRSGSGHAEANYFPPPEPRGLFGPDDSEPDGLAARSRAADELAAETARSVLRARAASGDPEALTDAHARGDVTLYREILDTLAARTAADPQSFRRLVELVARGRDLRATPGLAVALLDRWRESPSVASTAELLRVAALSDDAATFETVLTSVAEAYEEGRLRGLGGDELRALCEAEYWVLSPEAKRTGAGFVLKQTLAEVCRRLSAGARRESPPTAGAGDGRAPA